MFENWYGFERFKDNTKLIKTYKTRLLTMMNRGLLLTQ